MSAKKPVLPKRQVQATGKVPVIAQKQRVQMTLFYSRIMARLLYKKEKGKNTQPLYLNAAAQMLY